MDQYGGGEKPYFFEKHFPVSYHLTFNQPLHRHSGSFGVRPEEVDQRSQITDDKFEVFINVTRFKPVSVEFLQQTIKCNATELNQHTIY